VQLQTDQFREFAGRPSNSLSRLAAILLLAVLFVVSVYRAATQSISHDEAVIFEWLLSGPWGQVLNGTHGNHHVITDLLSKLMISIFGTSEMALRVPALIGALVYFFSIFRISAFLFGDGLFFLLSVSLLSLNPFVLDYLCCARGYGLALGLFFYAIDAVLRCLGEDAADASGATRLLHHAGAGLGLSIGCNPVMIFPSAALALAVIGLRFAESSMRLPDAMGEAAVRAKGRNPKKERRRKRREAGPGGAWQAFVHFVVPAIVIGGFFSILPQQLIELEQGYFGPPSLLAILEGLVRGSIVHSASGIRGLTAWLPAQTVIEIATEFAIPAVLVLLVAAAVRASRLWRTQRKFTVLTRTDHSLLLLGGMLPLAIVLIVVSRHLFNQPYPELRTAMYWLPLLTLASLCLVQRLGEGSRLERGLAIPAAAVLVLCVVQFLSQFNTRYFAEWSYCAAGKEMMRMIRTDHGSRLDGPVRVGATWQLEPVINFYRVAWNLNWMAPVYRESPAGSFDYYVLAFEDRDLADRWHLQTLLADRLSGTVLAKRP
jgi:hypothetical protein